MDTRHNRILEIAKEKLTCSGHSLDHVLRVYNLCILIAEDEIDVDMDVLIPSALLHDIARIEENADITGKTDHAVLGAEMAGDILKDLHYEEHMIEKIKHCILAHRFRTENEPKTIEAKILFDSDKLDAIGASGIARSFMLAGQFGQRLEPMEVLDEYLNVNTGEGGRLKDASKHSPFIEYELKFKKIPHKLYTERAKKIGRERLKFMDDFFTRLTLEMDGKG